MGPGPIDPLGQQQDQKLRAENHVDNPEHITRYSLEPKAPKEPKEEPL